MKELVEKKKRTKLRSLYFRFKHNTEKARKDSLSISSKDIRIIAAPNANDSEMPSAVPVLKKRKKLRLISEVDVFSKFVIEEMQEEFRSFQRVVSRGLENLMNGMSEARLEPLESNVSVLILPDEISTCLMGAYIAEESLFVRHFYNDLISLIFQFPQGVGDEMMPRYVLLGSPGIGKSVFQNYILARLVNPSLFEEPPPCGLQMINVVVRQAGDTIQVILPQTRRACIIRKIDIRHNSSNSPTG